MRERDLVARLGGDEFVVVLTDLGGRSGAVQDSVERVREALAEPIRSTGDWRWARRSASRRSRPTAATRPTCSPTRTAAMYAAKGARNGSLR